MITGILHIDLDAFFVSVEQALRPELKGKPVIVGGRPDRRGVVASASYEARKFGVRAAMPLMVAYRLCPDAIFLQGNHEIYADYSDRFMQILSGFSPHLEPCGLDEAYLDIKGCDIFGTPREIAMKIKQKVRNELGLVASVGIASCKIVAKIASDFGKPDGLVEVPMGGEKEFLAPLPIGKMPGIGTKTEQRLKSLGIETIGQLAALPQNLLRQQFGSYGVLLHQYANGIDNSSVESYDEQKSISRETTFGNDIKDREHLHAVLRYLCEKVGLELRSSGKEAQSVSIKVRFSDFETINRTTTTQRLFNTDDAIYQLASSLLDKALGKFSRPVRLIGVEVSRFSIGARQLNLFDRQTKRQLLRNQAIDRIRQKYGFDTVKSGQVMALKQIFTE